VNILLLVQDLDVGGTQMMVCALARHLRAGGAGVQIGCLDAVGTLCAELRGAGFPLRLFGRRPGFDGALAVRLGRHVRRGGFDVVHAHQRTALFYGLLAGLLHATPLVYTEHGPLQGRGPSRKKKVFNRLLGRRIRRVTAVAEDVKRRLVEEEGFDPLHIEIVPNGVDLGRFSDTVSREVARARHGLSPQACILGTVGRLVPVKNQALLLHVIARLRTRVPDAQLVVVGDGPERSALEALARRLEVADRVRFLGECRNIETVLPAFDVFCHASLAEGIPLTLLEAMAAHVPVVATAVGGIPEAARPDREAVLVAGTPPDGRAPLTDVGLSYVDELGEAVVQLLQDPARRRRLAERAYERVAELFSMDTVCRRYADILAAASGRASR
jgi:glycosyltransferase involved in cell wall biosynthesis